MPTERVGNHSFNPLNSMSLSQKLTLGFFTSFILVLLFALQILDASTSKLDHVKAQKIGANSFPIVYEIIQHTQIVRGKTNQYLNGDKAAFQSITRSRQLINTKILELESLLKNVDTPELMRRFNYLNSSWTAMSQSISDEQAEQTFAEYSKLISGWIDFNQKLAIFTKLTLTNNITQELLSSIISKDLVSQAEYLGQLRGSGAGTIASSNPQNLTSLQELNERVYLDNMLFNIELIYQHSSTTKQNLKTLELDLVGKVEKFKRQTLLVIENKNQMSSEAYFELGTQAVDSFFTLANASMRELDDLIKQQIVDQNRQLVYLAAALICGLVLVITLGYLISKSIIQPTKQILDCFRLIGDGDYTTELEINSKDELGKVLLDLSRMQKKLSENREHQQSRVKRLTSALEVCRTNIMVADAELNVVYLNRSAKNLFIKQGEKIKESIPHFDPMSIVGTNIDVFHQNPAHQRTLLDKLTDTFETEIKVNQLTFVLIVTPVIDEEGTRLGMVVEWKDRTAEIAMEKEIAQLLKSAAKGDLSRRIDGQEAEGFIKVLTDGLNELTSIFSEVINETADMLHALANGHLNKQISGNQNGIFGKLNQDANSTIENLKQVITQINMIAAEVNCEANKLSAGNTELNSKAETQASSLEETAASMEQMTATVQTNSENAKKASEQAISAREIASRGGEVVSQAVNSMKEINEASKEINDIIGVIDDIAFQTNLLALNAAVEAARAGEQGRGFAVVAGEVRNLAQRSAAAAKEIKALIKDSVSKIEEGSCLVNDSGENLQDIIDSVKKVSSMVNDISQASLEQSSGISQVNSAITEMDNVTQQNMQIFEAANISGQSIRDKSEQLTLLLSFFTLDEASQSTAKVSKVEDRFGQSLEVKQKTLKDKGPMHMASADDKENWDDF